MFAPPYWGAPPFFPPGGGGPPGYVLLFRVAHLFQRPPRKVAPLCFPPPRPMWWSCALGPPKKVFLRWEKFFVPPGVLCSLLRTSRPGGILGKTPFDAGNYTLLFSPETGGTTLPLRLGLQCPEGVWNLGNLPGQIILPRFRLSLGRPLPARPRPEPEDEPLADRTPVQLMGLSKEPKPRATTDFIVWLIGQISALINVNN